MSQIVPGCFVSLFLGKIAPKELKAYTQSADLGISLEEDLGLNYRFALPNKLFDYIQAEIPVIVSDLPDMCKLVTDFNIGEILRERNPKALADLVSLTLDKNYKEELRKAKNELSWEKEKLKLIKLIND